MAPRITKAQAAALPPGIRKQIEAASARARAEVSGGGRRGKYGNRRTAGPGGVIYDSRAEARHAGELELMRAAGLIKAVRRQVEVRLPCGVAYRMDFEVTDNDGKRHVQDVKGYETEVFKLKRRMLKGCPCLEGGPIEIEVIP